MKTISIVNLKGGVGKTTTAVNFAFDLIYNHQKRVLLIDLDPQSNTTRSFGIDITKISQSIADVLQDRILLSNIIIEIDKLHLAPSSIKLALTQRDLQNESLGALKLNGILKDKNLDYEYIIIDTPPTPGMLLDNALLGSDEFIVPIETGYYALMGLVELIEYVENLKSYNKNLKFKGILPTFVDNTNVAKEVLDVLREQYKGNVFDSVIKRRVKIKEAPSLGLPIHLHDHESAKDYVEFTKEYLGGSHE